MNSTTAMEVRVTQLAQALAMAKEVIASGNLDVDKEIHTREASAQLAELIFDATRDHSRLLEALQDYQAIVRLLKTPSLQRATYLDKLAYLEMTLFSVTRSMKVLDDSIAHSTQARDDALPTNDPLLVTIFQNLGYSVSHRAQLTDNPTDIDQAIECGQEILHRAAPDSPGYRRNMVNLGSRLFARYRMTRRADDLDQALSLVDKQLEMNPPGSSEHGSALLVKANMLRDKYEQSGDIQDLERAISGFTSGLDSDKNSDELRSDILDQLSLLYHKKYKETGEKADLETALGYSRQRLLNTPATYPTRPAHIADYLSHLVEYTLLADSMGTVQDAIKEARSHRDEVPKAHAKHHSCNLSMAGLLSKQYLVSHDVNHLRDLISHTISSVHEWNEKLDVTRPKVPTDELYRFSSYIGDIDLHESRTPFDSMVAMCRIHVEELGVLCKNLGSDHALSQDELSAGLDQVEKDRAAKAAEDRKSSSQMRNFKRDDYTDPFFGHRQLAVDAQRKRIVVSMEGLVRSVLGYQDDEEEPKTWSEFEAREARLERESLEKQQAEGKFPNPKLCRLCRHVKLLKATGGGAFVWDTNQFFPFGTYTQLLTRNHCSICRLILSLTTAEGNRSLHSQLANIDPEIQGTQFHAQVLQSGEVMLGVDCETASQVIALKSALDHGGSPLSALDAEDQMVDFNVIRTWLYDCHGLQGELCNGVSKTERYLKDIPLLLVDVQDNCLVQATSAERYLTLSYVWGKVDISTTKTTNLTNRLRKSSLDPSSFPKTIRDAMTLVRSLGERYLWTDALCVIQDDDDTRDRDISNMDIVYQKGFSNIVALAGSDADAGLPGVTPKSRPPQKIEVLEISKNSEDLALRDDGDGDGETETLYMVATPRPLSFAQTSSTWNTRGWILQEQTLARRNIYFSPNYVYFQCNQEIQCEVTLEGPIQEDKSSRGKEEGEQGASVTIKNPLTLLRKIDDRSGPEHLRRVFSAYSELVEIYTRRDLTQPTDVLDAFAGMLSTFRDEFKSEILYGIPIAAFDLALLWTPTQTLNGRPGRKSTSRMAAFSTSPSAPDTEDAIIQNFPTWSWAGWIGSVDYRLLPLDKESAPESLIGEIYIIRHGKILRLINYHRPCPDEDAKASPDLLNAYFGRISTDARQTFRDTILHVRLPIVSRAGFTIDRSRSPDYLSSNQHVHLQTSQAVVRIHDKAGRHCGILFEHLDYHSFLQLVRGQDMSQIAASLESMMTLDDNALVAVSHTKDTYGRREALTRVEGDVKRFDASEFPEQGPRSALVNVLVLRPAVGCFERIAVGQIHVRAWEEAGPKRMWIKIG
ncbi:hypothetical protein CLAIMM_05025 [Cladophialophora immunda]|nr:hypothetical protein CLAIMM_05025 [Cladophialophora immunda]